MRGRVEGAMSVQLSAVGSQSSGVSTGALGSNTSELSPPPMVSTVPSGSNVRLCSVRGKAIGPVWRQCGFGAVMSSTYVVATDGAPVSCVHVPVAGLNTSGNSALHSLQFTSPPTTSMRPSGKVVTVGYQRPTAIVPPDVQD